MPYSETQYIYMYKCMYTFNIYFDIFCLSQYTVHWFITFYLFVLMAILGKAIPPAEDIPFITIHFRNSIGKKKPPTIISDS